MFWAQEAPLIRSSTREVVVEVSVRDKHGKPFKKVAPEDVSVFEDGVRRDLRSFRLVSGADARTQEKEHIVSTALNPIRTVNLISLVIGNLLMRTRADAFKAARKFAGAQVRPNTFIALFAMAHGKILQRCKFTNDRKELLRAIDALEKEPVLVASNYLASDPLADCLAPGGAMEDVNGLQTLIRDLSPLPYQKTVMLFIGDLDRPANFAEAWFSLIERARAARTTFYGWSTESLSFNCDPLDGSRDALSSAAKLSATESTVSVPPPKPGSPNYNGHQPIPVPPPDPAPLGDTDIVRWAATGSNWHQAAIDLTTSTGGFFIDNTNNTDLLQAVMDDLDTRYEISYRPTSELLDGRFHKIEVKLARTDLRVDTREGYFAVPDEDSLTEGDMAALRALNMKPLPQDFHFEAKAFWFREQGKESQYSIVFDVPVSRLTAKAEPELKRHAFHAILFADVKNANGEIIARFSKDVPSEVSDEYLPHVQTDRLTFERALLLPAEARSVETVVVDSEGQRSSVKVFPLPAREAGNLSMSDIVLAKRVEILQGAADTTDPFQFDRKRVVPSLAQTVTPNQKLLAFAFAYPNPKSAEKLGLTIRCLRAGKLLAERTSSNLPQPDASGRVPVLMEVAAIPGTYTVVMKATQGSDSIERSLTYSVLAK